MLYFRTRMTVYVQRSVYGRVLTYTIPHEVKIQVEVFWVVTPCSVVV